MLERALDQADLLRIHADFLGRNSAMCGLSEDEAFFIGL